MDKKIKNLYGPIRLQGLRHAVGASCKLKPKFFKLVVCNPCQSSPCLAILVPL